MAEESCPRGRFFDLVWVVAIFPRELFGGVVPGDGFLCLVRWVLVVAIFPRGCGGVVPGDGFLCLVRWVWGRRWLPLFPGDVDLISGRSKRLKVSAYSLRVAKIVGMCFDLIFGLC
mgnify:CR=1 FL=1